MKTVKEIACECVVKCFNDGYTIGVKMENHIENAINEALNQVNSVDFDDVVGSFNPDDVIEVAERLYYEANPNTKSDVPSFVYEQTEKANKRRFMEQSKLTLYDWCKQEIA